MRRVVRLNEFFDDGALQRRASRDSQPDVKDEGLPRFVSDLRRQAGTPVEFVARSHFPTFPAPRQAELMDRLITEVAPYL